MEHVQKRHPAAKREEVVVDDLPDEAETDILDDTDELLDVIEDVLEESVEVASQCLDKVADIDLDIASSRATQQLEDSKALWELGLYSPQELEADLDQTLNSECRICGRCPVKPGCAELGA